MKKLLFLFMLISAISFAQNIDSTGTIRIAGKSITLTPEQLFKIDSSLAAKIGITQETAKHKADSLANLAKAEQQAIKDNPTSTSGQRDISMIMLAIMAVLGFVAKAIQNKSFDNIILQHLAAQTSTFWIAIAWITGIVLLICLGLVGFNDFIKPILNHTALTIFYYLITICFSIWTMTRFTRKHAV